MSLHFFRSLKTLISIPQISMVGTMGIKGLMDFCSKNSKPFLFLRLRDSAQRFASPPALSLFCSLGPATRSRPSTKGDRKKSAYAVRKLKKFQPLTPTSHRYADVFQKIWVSPFHSNSNTSFPKKDDLSQVLVTPLLG